MPTLLFPTESDRLRRRATRARADVRFPDRILERVIHLVRVSDAVQHQVSDDRLYYYCTKSEDLTGKTGDIVAGILNIRDVEVDDVRAEEAFLSDLPDPL